MGGWMRRGSRRVARFCSWVLVCVRGLEEWMDVEGEPGEGELGGEINGTVTEYQDINRLVRR
jgi:hypothetical protein